MKLLLSVLLLSLFLVACNKVEDLDIVPEPGILGLWVIDSDSSGLKTFVRKDSFDIHKFGYSFEEENKCTIRIKVKCGEIPIFENIEANYSITNDSLIDIKYFYNRKTEYSLLIKSLTRDTLIVKNL